jgi:hypothetical protein
MASKIQIKNFGVTNADDARACVDLGADMIGSTFIRRARVTFEPTIVRRIVDGATGANLRRRRFRRCGSSRNPQGRQSLPAFGVFNCMDEQRLNRAANWVENFA